MPIYTFFDLLLTRVSITEERHRERLRGPRETKIMKFPLKMHFKNFENFTHDVQRQFK